MANQELGTNFNSSNIAGSYTNGTAYNIIIQSNQLTSAQFNNIQQSRYTTSGWQYFTGVGLAGHIADETNLGFAPSAFQSSNIGGNYSVSFAFHDDHGYANNPIDQPRKLGAGICVQPGREARLKLGCSNRGVDARAGILGRDAGRV